MLTVRLKLFYRNALPIRFFVSTSHLIFLAGAISKNQFEKSQKARGLRVCHSVLSEESNCGVIFFAEYRMTNWEFDTYFTTSKTASQMVWKS